jgi:L-alanine-DL-glutamate epimerase-like enolase superfamily enzyme
VLEQGHIGVKVGMGKRGDARLGYEFDRDVEFVRLLREAVADARGFRILRPHVKTLIAAGEREWDARGFAEVIDSGNVDVVGCDIGRAEGITGTLKVIELVEQADVWFNSHAWSSAVNTAASIALSASTPRCLLQELKPDENPMQHELVHEPFAQRDGWIEVPRRPGLGVEPKESILEKYRFE